MSTEAPEIGPQAGPYVSEPGDSLLGLAHRFDVDMEELRTIDEYRGDSGHLVDPGSELMIQDSNRLPYLAQPMLPDSELVYSPTATNFDVANFVNQQPGYLKSYREMVGDRWWSGGEVVELAAQSHSINPRILLAILEDRSGWLTSPERPVGDAFKYPIWEGDRRMQGLHLQLAWIANRLSEAYYGWREGSFRQFTFSGGDRFDVAPELNAGTVALQHLLAASRSQSEWRLAVGEGGFMDTYRALFGDPWTREVALYQAELRQPSLILPFRDQSSWVFTGGPHAAWGAQSPWAALDFAPKSDVRSDKEVVAVGDGVVARLGRGILVLDLDGDGFEQTGWSVLYLHLVSSPTIAEGDYVAQGQMIGWASTEGGIADGVHVHIARKFKGEWIPAQGAQPFELSGWRARNGSAAYEGVLYKEHCNTRGKGMASSSQVTELAVGETVEMEFSADGNVSMQCDLFDSPYPLRVAFPEDRT